YQRLGDVPRKRHIQFRENGTLLVEEVMGLEGFTGNESILYHLQSPCRVMKLDGFEPIERKEWVPDQHAHRHLKTFDVKPDGDEITGRRLLMWNADVEISLCRPSGSMDYFFRNGEATRSSSCTRGAARSRRSSATFRTRRATTSSSRAARRTGSVRTTPRSATSSSRRRA